MELLNWWNLIFALPIVLSVLLLLVSAVGGLGADHGTDASGVHADTPADAGIEADAEGADVTGDHDAAAGHAHPGGTLAWIGVGVVPVSLLLQAFLLFFGVLGLGANRLLGTAAAPERLIWGAFLLALLGGAGCAGGLGALARRFAPQDAPAARSRDLVGRTGQVVFTVTQTGGTVQVRDAGGTVHQVAARLPAGHAPLPSGAAILIAGVAADGSGAFLVEESPFTLDAEELKQARHR